MVISRTVEHYLHLRQQGVSHQRAVDHTRLRHGVLPGELTADLRQTRERLLGAAALIPASTEDHAALEARMAELDGVYPGSTNYAEASQERLKLYHEGITRGYWR